MSILFLISVLSLIFALVGAELTSFFIAGILNEALGFKLLITNSLSGSLKTLLISFLGLVLVCFPLLKNELNLSAQALLMPELKAKIKAYSYLPLFTSLFFLCVLFGNSYVIGGSFFLSLVIALLFSFSLGGFILKKGDNFLSIKNVYRMMVVRYLTRYRLKTLSIFLSLFLSTFLITFIPGIRSSLMSEIDVSTEDRPEHFYLIFSQNKKSL